MTYQQFKNKYIDKSVNVDGAYGAQCYDLAMAYMKEVWGIPNNLICRWSGGVRDFAEQFDKMFDTSKFELTKNSPTNVPPQGAVFVFNTGKFGHTGIIDSANLNNFTSLDQNWGNGVDGSGAGEKRIRLVNHNYNDMIGWITPKNNNQSDNQSDMKLQEQLNEKNSIIEKIKIGGWEKINEISTVYPNYYNNWGRAKGNVDNLTTENPYLWVKEMADQISWNYTPNTEVEKLKKQMNDDLLETGELKKVIYELEKNNTKLVDNQKEYLDQIDKLKLEIVSKDTKISQLHEQLTSAVTTPTQTKWDWHKAWVGLSKNGTFTSVFGVLVTTVVGLGIQYIPALEPFKQEIIISILSFTGISITGQNAVKIIKNI